jgi:hypothetical protein
MTVRIVQPASGANYLQFAYGDGTENLTAGQLIDVDPGSVLETAIGIANLVVPSSQALADAANGGAGGVSN